MSIQMDRMHTLASRPPPTVLASTYVQMSTPSSTTASGAEKPPSSVNPTVDSNDEKQSQMEQSLKRSITLVIWYKVCHIPLKLYSVTRLFNSHRVILFVSTTRSPPSRCFSCRIFHPWFQTWNSRPLHISTLTIMPQGIGNNT